MQPVETFKPEGEMKEYELAATGTARGDQ